MLIWRPEHDEQPAHDWRAAIDGIKLQSQATRTPRLTDALPLRIEQTAMNLRHAENAVRAHQAGLLAWEFRQHGATTAGDRGANGGRRQDAARTALAVQ